MIRKMQEKDLEQVVQLEQVCFSQPWSYKLLESGIYCDYDVYYVWEQEDKILGYANLRFLAGEGEIQRIAVFPEYRRLGIARKLMDAMEGYTKEHQGIAISLEVRASNESAKNLYKSYGFEIEAVRKGYYSNPTEDALIMWKRGI